MNINLAAGDQSKITKVHQNGCQTAIQSYIICFIITCEIDENLIIGSLLVICICDLGLYYLINLLLWLDMEESWVRYKFNYSLGYVKVN